MESEQPKPKPEQVKWDEAEWGKMEYREFNECPVCHCPNRYTQEALRDEMPKDEMKKKPPAPGSMKLIYQGPLFTTDVDVVMDSCCRCGAIYTVARSKKKKFMVGVMKNPRGN